MSKFRRLIGAKITMDDGQGKSTGSASLALPCLLVGNTVISSISRKKEFIIMIDRNNESERSERLRRTLVRLYLI